MNIVFNFTGAPLGAYHAYRPSHRYVAGAIISAAGTVLGSGISAIASSDAADDAADAAQRNVEDTNRTNLLIAQDTNRTSTENTQLTNQTNIDLQEKQNQFNLEQWNRTNEYNSPTAQKTRLMAAGYNPNLFGSGAGGTTSPVQQTTLPQQSIPNLVTPQMQNSADAILQGGLQKSNILSNFVNQTAGAVKQVAETQGIKLDNEFKGIYNNQALEIIRTDIGLKGSQARQFQAFTAQTYSSIQEIAANTEKIRVEMQKIDSETTAQDIDNFWKSDMYAKNIEYMTSQTNLNDTQKKCLSYMLPLQMGLVASQTSLNHMSKELIAIQKGLTAAEIKQVEQYTKLIYWNKMEQWTNYGILKDYGKKFANGELDRLDYSNSPLGRTVDGASGILVGLGAFMGGAAALKGKGGKTPKNNGQSYSQSDGSHNTMNYISE